VFPDLSQDAPQGSPGHQGRRRNAMDLAQPQTKLKSMPIARRKVVDWSETSMIKTSLPETGANYPLIIQPAMEGVDLSAWAKSNRDYITTKLYAHGAILFRGFQIESVAAFEGVAESLYKEVYGGYGDLPRAGASERIYQSTPYPADKAILFHNESSHLHSWPMKISFHCIQASREGGETPLLDCRQICNFIDPAVLRRFEEKGLMYVRNFIEGIDVSWERFFSTSDKAVVEETCRRENVECEWTKDNGLRMRHRTDAVTHHPYTKEKVFFNQIQLHHPACLDTMTREALLSLYGADDLPRNVLYGDGTPIEDSILDEIGELYWKHCVALPWREGDMIMLDNMLTAHARNPFSGPRQIVVAMGEMIDAGSY
jgi:hypothetical protein